MKKNLVIAAVLVFAGASAFATAKTTRLTQVWYETSPGTGCTLVQANVCGPVNQPNCVQPLFDLSGSSLGISSQIFAAPINTTTPVLNGCTQPYDRP